MCLYLDDEMLDIDHVCCMVHVRAKFKYTAEIGHDVNAHKSSNTLETLRVGKEIYRAETSCGRYKTPKDFCRNDGNNNRNEKPARPDENRKCPAARKPGGKSGQLPRPFLEPGIPILEGRGLHDRQQPDGTVYPTFSERAEEFAVLR